MRGLDITPSDGIGARLGSVSRRLPRARLCSPLACLTSRVPGPGFCDFHGRRVGDGGGVVKGAGEGQGGGGEVPEQESWGVGCGSRVGCC